jgi:hypothetical protein
MKNVFLLIFDKKQVIAISENPTSKMIVSAKNV